MSGLSRGVLFLALIAPAVACNSNTAVGTTTLNLSFVDRGWYTASGLHMPANTNYFVGDLEDTSLVPDFRNFFVFDLSGVSHPIVGAELALSTNGAARGFESPTGSETYGVFDVNTPISNLTDGSGSVAAHTDLGTGDFFGSREVTEADSGSIVVIPLNSLAIAAMNAADGSFALGGANTTLDDVSNDEAIFALTGNAGDISELRLTLVPEPATWLLTAIGLIYFGGRRRA